MLLNSTLSAAAKSLQSCPTLCDPIDGSPPGSLVPGNLQARTLEWVAISFFNAWKWKVKGKSLSRVRPSATPWTAAFQAPPFMGFSRQEYWSGVPLPSPVHYLTLEKYFSCPSQIFKVLFQNMAKSLQHNIKIWTICRKWLQLYYNLNIAIIYWYAILMCNFFLTSPSLGETSVLSPQSS